MTRIPYVSLILAAFHTKRDYTACRRDHDTVLFITPIPYFTIIHKT